MTKNLKKFTAKIKFFLIKIYNLPIPRHTEKKGWYRYGDILFTNILLRNKVFMKFLYMGQSLYGTKFIRDKVYAGQSLYKIFYTFLKISYGYRYIIWDRVGQSILGRYS